MESHSGVQDISATNIIKQRKHGHAIFTVPMEFPQTIRFNIYACDGSPRLLEVRLRVLDFDPTTRQDFLLLLGQAECVLTGMRGCRSVQTTVAGGGDTVRILFVDFLIGTKQSLGVLVNWAQVASLAAGGPPSSPSITGILALGPPEEGDLSPSLPPRLGQQRRRRGGRGPRERGKRRGT